MKVSLADTAKPVIGAGAYTYIVKITYTDGSVDYATAPFAYTNYDSDGLFLDYIYAGEHYLKAGELYSAEPQFWTQGMTGERVDGPDGVTYEVVGVTNPNIEASIDSKSNMLNYRFVSGKDGDSSTITVRAHYKDGGTEDYNFDVKIGENPYPSYLDPTADDIIQMWYGDNQVPVVAGQDHTLFPVFYIPVLSSSDSMEIPGATYELVDASPELHAKINSDTGAVTVNFDALPEVATNYSYMVRVIFPDGTMHEETFEFTLTDTATSPTEQPTDKSTAEPSPSGEPTSESAEPGVVDSTDSPSATPGEGADSTIEPAADSTVIANSTDAADSNTSAQQAAPVAVDNSAITSSVTQTSSDTAQADSQPVLAQTGAHHALGIFAGGLATLLIGSGFVLANGRRSLKK